MLEFLKSLFNSTIFKLHLLLKAQKENRNITLKPSFQHPYIFHRGWILLTNLINEKTRI